MSLKILWPNQQRTFAQKLPVLIRLTFNVTSHGICLPIRNTVLSNCHIPTVNTFLIYWSTLVSLVIVSERHHFIDRWEGSKDCDHPNVLKILFGRQYPEVSVICDSLLLFLGLTENSIVSAMKLLYRHTVSHILHTVAPNLGPPRHAFRNPARRERSRVTPSRPH